SAPGSVSVLISISLSSSEGGWVHRQSTKNRSRVYGLGFVHRPRRWADQIENCPPGIIEHCHQQRETRDGCHLASLFEPGSSTRSTTSGRPFEELQKPDASSNPSNNPEFRRRNSTPSTTRNRVDRTSPT